MHSASTPRPANLRALLAVDRARRRVRVADGLIPLECLAPQSWDYSAPTIVGPVYAYKDRGLCPNSASFMEQFYETYPSLKGVPLHGILIAGSSVGQFLTRRGPPGNRPWKASDVDAFLYGHKDTEASRYRLNKLVTDLEESFHRRGRASLREVLKTIPPPRDINQQHSRDPQGRPITGEVAEICALLMETISTIGFERRGTRTMVPERPKNITRNNWECFLASNQWVGYDLPYTEVIRTAGSITILAEDLKLQIILRHYSTVSEILHGFDLGPSAVGFDGSQVWFTELGRFAYECGCTVVDTTRRSTTYEARLKKYYDRGFSLILPELNIEALSRRNNAYGISDVADLPGLPFSYSSIDGNRITLHSFLKESGPCSDYGPDEGSESFTLAYMNLYRLVNGRTDFIHAAQGNGYETVRVVLTKPPHLTLQMIQTLYDHFRKSCWDGARLNIRTLERYVPLMPLSAITRQVFEAGRSMAQVLDEAFAAQRVVATRLWNLHIRDADHTALPWVVENPGGQQSPLTGSLNPIIEDPVKWYGNEYLVPSDH